MMLSFSVPEMRPYLEAGLRQRKGEDVGAARVKRQTIRRRGPRADALIEHAEQACWTIPYELQLTWLARTKDCAPIGVASYGDPQPHGIYAYPIEILHSSVVPPDAPEYQCLRIVLPRGFVGGHFHFWSPQDGGRATRTSANGIARMAYADGFDSVEAFRDFFVPERGNRFDGILYRW